MPSILESSAALRMASIMSCTLVSLFFSRLLPMPRKKASAGSGAGSSSTRTPSGSSTRTELCERLSFFFEVTAAKTAAMMSRKRRLAKR